MNLLYWPCQKFLDLSLSTIKWKISLFRQLSKYCILVECCDHSLWSNFTLANFWERKWTTTYNFFLEWNCYWSNYATPYNISKHFLKIIHKWYRERETSKFWFFSWKMQTNRMMELCWFNDPWRTIREKKHLCTRANN